MAAWLSQSRFATARRSARASYTPTSNRGAGWSCSRSAMDQHFVLRIAQAQSRRVPHRACRKWPSAMAWDPIEVAGATTTSRPEVLKNPSTAIFGMDMYLNESSYFYDVIIAGARATWSAASRCRMSCEQPPRARRRMKCPTSVDDGRMAAGRRAPATAAPPQLGVVRRVGRSTSGKTAAFAGAAERSTFRVERSVVR